MRPNQPLPTAPELADRFALALRHRRQPEKVAGMEAYMRHQFAFLGVAAPGQQDAYREATAGLPRALPQELVLPTLERLLTTEPWWDTVDSLATHALGSVVRHHPDRRTTMDRWLERDDMWLTRSALLHMNRWKADTDRDWLFAACLRRADHPDFFIRKAIGWALREHSKVDAAAVIAFVDDHAGELSGLSRREALMWLERRRRRTGS